MFTPLPDWISFLFIRDSIHEQLRHMGPLERGNLVAGLIYGRNCLSGHIFQMGFQMDLTPNIYEHHY